MLNQITNFLFVVGMFRSGTTLVARLLNTHSQIILASDTLIEFFRAFRNEIYQKNGIKLYSQDYPLEEFFLSKNRIWRDKIENLNFNIPIQNTDLGELRTCIKNKSKLFSPLFSENLNSLKGKTFAEVFEELLSTMEQSYHKPNSKILGFKVTWSEQFATTFLNEFPIKGKVLFVIRDPRATVGSNFAMDMHRYPLIFLIRQWRKSVYYAILCTQLISRYKNNCLITNYENLIKNPKIEIEKIMSFLNLKFENNLMDPRKYKDGMGKTWIQNTSFNNATSTFNISTLNNWRNVVDKKTQKFIEYSCFPEMTLFGYEPELISKKDVEWKCDYPMDLQEEIADWIQKFYPSEKINNKKWIDKIENNEKMRNKMLVSSLNDSNYIEKNSKKIQEFFMDVEYFKYLRNFNQNRLT